MMLKHNITSYLKILLVSWVCLANLAFAKTAPLAIDIQSDSAEIDERQNCSIHEGHVSMKQGVRSVFADRLEIYRDANQQLRFLVAKGKPAHLHIQNKAPDTPLEASAYVITFYPQDHQLLLEGHASMQDQHQRIQGQRLRYFIKEHRGFADSPSSEHPVRLSLFPKTISVEKKP